MADLDALYDMERRDPDGGPVQPTASDYARFERWAVETYGQDAYRAYMVGGWAPAPEV